MGVLALIQYELRLWVHVFAIFQHNLSTVLDTWIYPIILSHIAIPTPRKHRKPQNSGTKMIFHIGTLSVLILTVSTNAFRSTNLSCCFSRYQAPTNEWFASNRIPCYAQKTLGSPGGKHCLLLEGNAWRKAVSTSKKRDCGERSTLFCRSFIADGLGECWNAENVSFC